jgi:NOL1/NOP2/sun family putative RNA methylase
MTILFDTYREFIPDFQAFQESLLETLPTHLRVNPLKVDTSLLIRSLEDKPVRLEKSVADYDTFFKTSNCPSPGTFLEYYLGYFHPQALTSCLASIALNPVADSFVLDLCAAPGGKTSHMAQLMNNSGLIIANELIAKRQIPLGHTLNRLGVLNTVITPYQAQEFPLREKFDFVLADVPCSAEGIYRKLRPEYTYREMPAKEKLPAQQRRIILRGFDLLKEDGRMLYATCTYNPLENESVVDFLLKRREAELLPIRLGVDYDAGIGQWQEEQYDPQITRAARFYPHRIDSVGFFMACIGRKT